VKTYGDDLAYIHDAGHGHFARAAGPAVLDLLRQAGIASGLLIDLGCGSGIMAREVCAAGYDVLGIDVSAAMIDLARQRVPAGQFRVGSFLTADLPSCVAVTSIGECFNYLFDDGNTTQGLQALFGRIFAALAPGGLLVFDVAGPGRVPGGGPRQSYREGDDWAVLVTTEEDRAQGRLTRRITSFRKVGELYRRDHEFHRLRLLPRAEVTAALRKAGFRVRGLAGYGDFKFGPGSAGFVARKPQTHGPAPIPGVPQDHCLVPKAGLQPSRVVEPAADRLFLLHQPHGPVQVSSGLKDNRLISQTAVKVRIIAGATEVLGEERPKRLHDGSMT
jgi:SAM-dependent methyltransferase